MAAQGALEARIQDAGRDPDHSDPFSSQARVFFFFFSERSSCCLQMHKVPFGVKFFISFSSLRQRLAPLTCLTRTRSVF